MQEYLEEDEVEAEELSSDALYPSVIVQLVGEDGNVFSIMGRVAKALKIAGVSQGEVNRFYEECKATGSYHGVLHTCTQWVTVR